MIIESKNDLENDLANINTNQIKRLYEKAMLLIPDLQKSFEETVSFHNQMIKQKVEYVTEELPTLDNEIRNHKRELNLLISSEKELSLSLSKSGAIEDLQLIINELNEYYEKKGNLEEMKRLWEKSNENLKNINERIEIINTNIISKDEVIQKRIEEFNEYFSEISNKLDGVHSYLSADNDGGIYKFKISTLEENPGTGSKKSQMASFDLAYIKFADANNIPCLHFILQDQIENVHSNQITNLLTEIVDDVNCQYVLSVLRDKLPNTINISSYEVVSLSQNDKLFKVQ
ncbi:DUF2326 domain-containing protein [Empedobacter falsenii]|uniref:Uncharacterized protein conserved in bacteria (DUF2326) n=1 Tax=Empedobacter falsenii TaxID=343874 RepID=A0A376GK35_9FLAO|nr:DUF2326 domain-containing protein [Empedobacter falsenii]STD59303.1 Uncharacterized protein conserved in bacteria (DUF2326) [Empedobacter falsenii]